MRLGLALGSALTVFTLALSAQTSPPPYKDGSLPVEKRVADLLGRMTLEEKVAQTLAVWQQKRQLVESLWRIAFADAELATHEEYLVRKIAGQLGLSTADLVETKIRAREDFLKEEL